MTDEDVTFLLVEDNDLDAEKVERTLARMQIGRVLVRARDGLEALDLMRGVGSDVLVGKRFITLLDLNMPRMTGIEMLAEIQEDLSLDMPPVFIMTTSSRPDDICGAYRYKICGYAVKPLDEEELARVVSSSQEYWDNAGAIPQAQVSS